ncbi:MAG: hypothetical protein IT443_02540 [Phycisphaeraceae bacterium]|nr:hypothetical protein [Phycisphaeraceae bacterium]
MLVDLQQLARTTKYPAEAFVFVQRGLDFTVKRMHGPKAAADADAPPQDSLPGAKGKSRHITGQQLCYGLRDFAIAQYGLMARAVLRNWHITRSDDFGAIVFAMVDAGLMQKTEEDDLKDFADVFSFDQAFVTELELTE